MRTYNVDLMYGTVANPLHITSLLVYANVSVNHSKELRCETFVRVYHDGANSECFIYDRGLTAFVLDYLKQEQDEDLYSALPDLNWSESGMSTNEYYHLIFGVW